MALIFYFFIMKTEPAGTTKTGIALLPDTVSSIESSFNNAVSSISTATNKIVADIQNIATQNNIDPAILYGIVTAEQGTTNPTEWNTQAYNPNDPGGGAYGLTQILGTTAQSLGVNPAILQQSASAALETTVKYINTYSPNPNDLNVTAAIYNGGPSILNNIANGTASGSTQQMINSYVNKAQNGYDYYNQVYGGGQ